MDTRRVAAPASIPKPLSPYIADRFPYPFLNIDYLGIGGALPGLLQVVAAFAVVAAIVIGLDRAVAALGDRRRRARGAPDAPGA